MDVAGSSAPPRGRAGQVLGIANTPAFPGAWQPYYGVSATRSRFVFKTFTNFPPGPDLLFIGSFFVIRPNTPNEGFDRLYFPFQQVTLDISIFSSS